MATLVNMWNAKFGTNADPAGDPDATNASVGTNAVANVPPSGAYERGSSYSAPYSASNTKSIIVERNNYAEGSNLGSQGASDLGLGTDNGYASTIGGSTDVRDSVEENGSRRTQLEKVVANTTEVWENRSKGAERGTTTAASKIHIKVVRGRYRTSDPSALSTFQAKTARMAADDNDTVLGAFDVAV